MKGLLSDAGWGIVGLAGFAVFCVFAYLVLTAQFGIIEFIGDLI